MQSAPQNGTGYRKYSNGIISARVKTTVANALGLGIYGDTCLINSGVGGGDGRGGIIFPLPSTSQSIMTSADHASVHRHKFKLLSPWNIGIAYVLIPLTSSYIPMSTIPPPPPPSPNQAINMSLVYERGTGKTRQEQEGL